MYKFTLLQYYHHKGSTIKYSERTSDGEYNTLLYDSGVVNEEFKPSYLLMTGLFQTLFVGALQKHLTPPTYQREIIKLADGGQIALDSINFQSNSRGIIVLIPGIGGDGNCIYSINAVKMALKNNYALVVVNHRGLGNVKLLTPVTYHGGSNFDTKEAITHIQKKHPGMLIYGIGISLGANILSKYLGDEGEESVLAGAALVCSPLDPMESSRYSEKS